MQRNHSTLLSDTVAYQLRLFGMIGICQCQVPGYSTCAQSRDSSTIIHQLELYMAPNYMQEKLKQM